MKRRGMKGRCNKEEEKVTNLKYENIKKKGV
jgi:hypothetical protein